MSSGISSCSSDDVERSAHEASTAGYKLRKRSRETRNKMQRMARAINAEDDDEDYFSDSSQVLPPKRAKSHVRVSATKRERARMHKLNNAYDKLRKAVPKLNCDVGSKLSKIATLRLAIDYINMLTNFLEGNLENEERPETVTNSDEDTTSSIDDDSDILAKLIDSVVEEFGWFLDECQDVFIK